MNIPRTIQDIEKLIELKEPEGLHLEYKSIKALSGFSDQDKNEMCKDVSAFANSDGGILIYGVDEEQINKIRFPAKITGVDNGKTTKEQIDQIVTSRVNPIISVEIIEVKKTEVEVVFVIHIPKSFRGPHQAPDKKYYKRRNAVSEPMEHYEIEDVRNRRQTIPPLVNMDIQLCKQKVYLIVSNTGNEVARKVRFVFSDNFSWYKEQEKRFPNALKNGIMFLPPGRKMSFLVGTVFDFLSEKSKYNSFFDVSIQYHHPQSKSDVVEDIHIDLKDFLYSEMDSNFLEDISYNLQELKRITNAMSSIDNRLGNIENIAGATGVDLSVSTLIGLSKILKNDDSFQYINIKHCRTDAIQEVLGVDFEMASNIYYHYHKNCEETLIEDIPGMTEDILEKIKKCTK